MNSASTVTPRYTADVMVSPAGSVATTSTTTMHDGEEKRELEELGVVRLALILLHALAAGADLRFDGAVHPPRAASFLETNEIMRSRAV